MERISALSLCMMDNIYCEQSCSQYMLWFDHFLHHSHSIVYYCWGIVTNPQIEEHKLLVSKLSNKFQNKTQPGPDSLHFYRSLPPVNFPK